MKRLIYISLSFLIVACGLAFAVKPRSSSRIDQARRQASQQVDKTRRDMRLNQEQLTQTLDELYAIEARIDSLNRQMTRVKSSIAVYDDSIKRLNDSIEALTAEIDAIKGSLSRSLRDARSRRQSMTSLGMVLSSKNFNDGMRRISYIRQLDRSRARKANSLSSRRKELQESQDRLAAMRQKQQGLLATLDALQAAQRLQQTQAEEHVAILRHNHRDLDNELKRRQKRVNDLTTQLDRALAQEDAERKAAEAEAKRQAEEAEAQRLAAEAEAQKQAAEAATKPLPETQQATQSTAQAPKAQPKQDNKRGKRRTRNKPANQTPPSPTPTTPASDKKPSATTTADKTASTSSNKPNASKFGTSKGALPYPITGERKVVGYFGRSRHQDLSKIEIDNPGIEIQGRAGAQAVAVYDGQVAGVFVIDGLHNAVLIRHGEYITVYANIDSPAVKKGDTVRAGQPLGTVYFDEGEHPVLHFEIRKEKEKLNPLDWIK